MTVDGLDETLSLLENTSSPEKLNLFLRRLAEIGIGRAQRIYGVTTAEANAPDLSYEFIDNNTVCVKASGKDVLFLEFGTGITYMEDYPTDEGFEPIYHAGDWSDNETLGGKHHWNSPYGWWYYKDGSKSDKRHTMGLPP